MMMRVKLSEPKQVMIRRFMFKVKAIVGGGIIFARRDVE